MYNCGVSNLCSVGSLDTYKTTEQFLWTVSSLRRELVQSFKVVLVRSISFESNSVGGYVKGLLAVLSSGIKEGFNIAAVAKAIASSSNELPFPSYERCWYLHVPWCSAEPSSVCLFDDQRSEKSQFATFGLTAMYCTDEGDTDMSTLLRTVHSFLDPIEFVVRQSYWFSSGCFIDNGSWWQRKIVRAVGCEPSSCYCTDASISISSSGFFIYSHVNPWLPWGMTGLSR
jgi:hypothetical protein